MIVRYIGYAKPSRTNSSCRRCYELLDSNTVWMSISINDYPNAKTFKGFGGHYYELVLEIKSWAVHRLKIYRDSNTFWTRGSRWTKSNIVIKSMSINCSFLIIISTLSNDSEHTSELLGWRIYVYQGRWKMAIEFFRKNAAMRCTYLPVQWVDWY
jgi:hypothetical protein